MGPSPTAHVSRGVLPDYIRPLPAKFMEVDIDFLQAKGALDIPGVELRNELLKSYVQYVHPFMPLLDLDEFLGVILRGDASSRLSLLLFQAVMFAGTAFVDLRYLRVAGYQSRKDARKAFFQRARLLYDFDYELDRISLVQSLLLMTHWYEMPDDQKDTWHWMGVSLSLAHTIGLHRNPANANMEPRRRKLWKRIWWSTYTRDRLIALGMRRPTRIKDEDCDIPMLTIDDFDLKPCSPEIIHAMSECELLHNVAHQQELAIMFIEKAKLCLSISHVLSVQYSVLSHKFGGTTETTMMLVPKRTAAETCEVRRCDDELENWLVELPGAAQCQAPSSTNLSQGEEVIHLHRALLKMIFFATSSALHHPQVLPATPIIIVDAELQAVSRNKVRHAAVEITNAAQDLHTLDLTRYLPTTGVTVLLPAVIIHLLDIKSSDLALRNSSLHRFYQCMQVLQRLREIYASADFATSFLEAAIRKAGIQVSTKMPEGTSEKQAPPTPAPACLHTLTPPPDFHPETVFHAATTLDASKATIPHFPPFHRTDEDLFFASTPPNSVGSENGSMRNMRQDPMTSTDPLNPANDNSETSMAEFMTLAHEADITQNDLDALINFDGNGGTDMFATDEGPSMDFDLPGLPGPGGEDKMQLDMHMQWVRDFTLGNDEAGNSNSCENDDNIRDGISKVEVNRSSAHHLRGSASASGSPVGDVTMNVGDLQALKVESL